MLEKFRTIFNSLSVKGRNPVALFAIMKMDDLEDKWTVIYADESSSSSEQEKNLIFSFILNEMKKILSAEELNQIARISVFTTKEHLVRSLLSFQTGARISNQKVNGNFVHEGYIIKGSEDSNQGNKMSLPTDNDGDNKSKAIKGGN